jgi:hypothetical protein
VADVRMMNLPEQFRIGLSSHFAASSSKVIIEVLLFSHLSLSVQRLGRLRVAKAWYGLEAERDGAHWSELYHQDSAAEALGEAFGKLTNGAEPPYWVLAKERQLAEEGGWR